MNYILSHKNCRNKMYFLIKFIEKNMKINKLHALKIIDFINSHLKEKDNRFYFYKFEKPPVFQYSTEKPSINDNQIIKKLKNEYVEICDILKGTRLKIMKIIINLIFDSIKEIRSIENIEKLNDLLKPIFLRLVPLNRDKKLILLKYLSDCSTNISSSINKEGYKKYEMKIKNFLELLNHTRSCRGITFNKNSDDNVFNLNNTDNNKDENDKNIKKILDEYIFLNDDMKINEIYIRIIKNLFKILSQKIPENDFELDNIIPVIYSYCLSLNYYNNNILNNNNENNLTSKDLLNVLHKILIDNHRKNCNEFISCDLSLYYILYFLKDICNQSYYDFAYSIIIKILNLDEFKPDNHIINARNYILIKVCLKIMSFEFSNDIHKSDTDLLEMLDKKHQIITRIKKFIRKHSNIIKKHSKKIANSLSFNNLIEDKTKENNIGNIPNNIHNCSSPEKKQLKKLKDKNNNIEENLKYDQEYPVKIKLLTEYLEFEKNTNFITTHQNYFYENLDEENDDAFFSNVNNNDYLGNSINLHKKFENWVKFLDILTNNKYPKKNKENELELALNLAFSNTNLKTINFVSVIKSYELSNEDAGDFLDFLSILGDIICHEKVIIKKENTHENYIYDFDREYIKNVVIVLYKTKMQLSDVELKNKFLIMVKPLRLKSIYYIQIKKNTFYENNDDLFKNIKKIDENFNIIYSDYIILDINDKNQVNNFIYLIEIIFNYSFVEEQLVNNK